MKFYNSITKTKEEAEQEELIKLGEKMRLLWISKIKEEIKTKASRGEYEVIGSKKRINGYLDCKTRELEDRKELRHTCTKKKLPWSWKEGTKFEKNCIASAWFLKQIKLMENEMRDDGIIGIKISNAFYLNISKKFNVTDEMTYFSTYDDQYKDEVYDFYFHIYYEMEY